MTRILVLCTHNSARSQIGEAWLRELSRRAGIEVEAWSAGTEKTQVKPDAITVMGEVGIDLSSQWSKTIEELPESNAFDAVITVCDSANQTCPMFPGKTRRYHVSIPDPSGQGLEKWRVCRAQVGSLMERLVKSLQEGHWPTEDQLQGATPLGARGNTL